MPDFRKLSFDEINHIRLLNNGLYQEKFPIIAALENIRSLYNVGSIFRTSDGAGVSHLILGGYTGFPPRKEIEKTALGSTETVPWERSVDIVQRILELKKNGYQIVAFEHTQNSIPYNEVKYKFPVCMLLGNEVDGLTQEIIDVSDIAVEIPMYGAKQSLNVSVAFGIAVYHVVNEYLKSC